MSVLGLSTHQILDPTQEAQLLRVKYRNYSLAILLSVSVITSLCIAHLRILKYHNPSLPLAFKISDKIFALDILVSVIGIGTLVFWIPRLLATAKQASTSLERGRVQVISSQALL